MTTELENILKREELDFLKNMIFSRNDENLNLLLDELLAVAKIIFGEELSKHLVNIKNRYDEEEKRRVSNEMKKKEARKHNFPWLGQPKKNDKWVLDNEEMKKWSTKSYNRHTSAIWTFNDIKTNIKSD